MEECISMLEVIHVALRDSFLYPRRAIKRTITAAGKLISLTAELSELANLLTLVITLISPTLATQEGVSARALLSAGKFRGCTDASIPESKLCQDHRVLRCTFPALPRL